MSKTIILSNLTEEQEAAIAAFAAGGYQLRHGENVVDFGNNAEARGLVIEIMSICGDNGGLQNALQILTSCVNGGGELVPAHIVQQWNEDSAAFQQVKEAVKHRTQSVPVAPPPFTDPVPTALASASTNGHKPRTRERVGAIMHRITTPPN